MESVRKASINDINVLNKMLTDFIRYEAINFDENNRTDLVTTNFFDKRLADANSIVLVYLDDEKIVGCIIGSFIRGNIIKKTDEFQIETVYVIEGYRGRKIGTKLINTLVSEVKDKGAKYILISNYAANNRAGNLYQKLGFLPHIVKRRKKI